LLRQKRGAEFAKGEILVFLNLIPFGDINVFLDFIIEFSKKDGIYAKRVPWLVISAVFPMKYYSKTNIFFYS